MADSDPIEISAGVLVPREELVLRASRSSGPGGQHVNTSSTRIELVWDIAASPSLDDDTRARLLQRLASRVDSAGKMVSLCRLRRANTTLPASRPTANGWRLRWTAGMDRTSG